MFSVSYFVVLLFIGAINAKNLPDFFQVCQRNNPDINECLKNSIYALKPHLETGVPEYDIPKLEPLFVPSLLNHVPLDTKKLRASINNVSFYGCSNYIIENIGADLENKVISFYLFLNDIDFHGEYNLGGRIGLMKVNSKGKMSGHLAHIRSSVALEYEIVERDGDEYIKITQTNIKMGVYGANIELHDLFPHTNKLTKYMSKVINSKLYNYIEFLVPHLRKQLSETLTKTCNKILSHYTYAQLLPED